MRLVWAALLVGAFLLDVLAALSPATASVAGVVQHSDRQQRQQEEQQQRLPGTAPNDPAATVRALGAVPAANQAGGAGATTKTHQDASSPARIDGSDAVSPMRRAYATLLYSDFIEGTRALGQSLRDSGTTADTVVLVTPDVRQDTRERLAQDGWM